ncbi:MAG: nitrogen regulation protein NR(II) [Spongiibacteraceae bacterium]|nr:nitrogen regulation protein NR(II) [Spongiibacteraceae bacterium]
MTTDKLHTEILDNLKTAILLVGPSLKVSYINTAAESLLEISGNRVIGEPISNLFTDDSNREDSLLNKFNDSHAYTKREAQLILPNGRTITADYAVTPIALEEGAPSLVIELQPLDRLLRISREEGLLSSQQHSQTLVRGLAHEIKNPLGGLRGAAQLLAKQLPDASLQDYTTIIIAEADRLKNLVDRMLGPYKVLELEAVNIHEVLERTKTLVDAETAGNIKVKRDYDPSIPEFDGDKERLIQALLNVVRNAMQALQQDTDNKDRTITLKTRTKRQFTIGAHRHRLVCKVEIIDNGPGIPQDIAQTLFLPMVSGRANGSGLGLSISQSIINRHNGLIECNSQSGCTVFTLYIPLEKPETHSINNRGPVTP